MLERSHETDRDRVHERGLEHREEGAEVRRDVLRVLDEEDDGPDLGCKMRIGVEFKFRTYLNFRTYTVP